ncbi:MAG: hypothetical protein WBP42_00265 [Candidatus Zixiibacteriota bacterium]
MRVRQTGEICGPKPKIDETVSSIIVAVDLSYWEAIQYIDENFSSLFVD